MGRVRCGERNWGNGARKVERFVGKGVAEAARGWGRGRKCTSERKWAGKKWQEKEKELENEQNSSSSAGISLS